MNRFEGSSIMVTGGTGTFGRHFIRWALANNVARRIVVFSRDEQKHFQMQIDFANDPRLRFFVGDVRDYDRLIMATRNVDYIVHAAAMKHVPLAEYNPIECIKTNVHGAENVIRAAITNNIKQVVALSTDKAANPINLYGASKLASDKLFSAANNLSGATGPRFAVVRYGNVVASKGSVVPFFERLIADGAKTIPITDPRMTRFWITLQQGVDFVVSAFQRMHGGEVFVPKIPSIRVTDLARAMAPAIPQDIVGIRPGEKLHEVMCPADDSHLTIEFDDHYVIQPTTASARVDYFVNKLGARGRPVPTGFEYASGSNPDFLDDAEILHFNAIAHSLDRPPARPVRVAA